jgi:hypothetical protein
MNILKIDENFPQRVINTSLILASLILLISISNWQLDVTIGLALGMGISIIFFMILLSTVKSLVIIENDRRILFFAIVTLLKFIVLSIVLFLLFKYLTINYLAFLIGIGLAQSIIFLKLIGIVLVNKMNKIDKIESKEITNTNLQMANK